MFSAIEEEGERLEREMRYREILERDREIKRKGGERKRQRRRDKFHKEGERQRGRGGGKGMLYKDGKVKT